MQLNSVIPPYALARRDVALVGNSPRLIGSSNGSRIDSFQEVFRFNCAPTAGFQKDCGTKTSVMLIGIDIGYVFGMGYKQPWECEDDDERRIYNSKILLRNYSCPLFVFSYSAFNETSHDMYRSASKYIKIAAEELGLAPSFHFFSDDPIQGLINCTEANNVLAMLHCKARLSKGGPRSGFRIALNLVRSGAKPALFGFDLDPGIKVSRHYYEDVTNDEDNPESPHDIAGEAIALLELHEMGLIDIY